MTVFRGIDSVSGGDQVATAEDIAAAEAAAAASAAEAAASAAAALVSEGLADADATATAADVVLTNADVVLTGLDVVSTNADVVSTNADVVTTTQDALDTAADVLLTNADVVTTNADAATTAQDAIDTAADVVLTNQDTIDTAADLVQTNLDQIATAADVVSTNADVLITNADAATTTQDAIDTAADVVLTNADVVASAASAAAALVSENAAAASAATIPAYDSTTGEALNFVRLNAGETSMEFRTPAEVLVDVGAEAADATILKDADIGVTVQAVGENANLPARNAALNQDPVSQGESTRSGMSSTIYTGNGTSQSITTGVDMATGDLGGLVWLKNRDAADGHVLTDTIRSSGIRLNTSSNAIEVSDLNTLTSFDSTGFSIGSDIKVNTNLEDYVAWSFQTNKKTTGTTNRNKAYTCHYNSDMGFSIVGYVGDGLDGHEIPHHLNLKGDGTDETLHIFKDRDATWDWAVKSSLLGDTEWLRLNATLALGDTPSTKMVLGSDTISLGTWTNLNATTDNFISYHFASVPGVSKVGKYIGTGAAGNYVDCGFKPAFVMVKSLTNIGSWLLYDAIRGDNLLLADLSGAESASTALQLSETGFHVSGTSTARNELNSEYVFLAFAETNTDATKAWADYTYPTTADTLTINQDTLISFADGFSAAGQVDTQENVGSGITYTLGAGHEDKHYWLYKDKAGAYGVSEYRPLEGITRNDADKWGEVSPLDSSLRNTAKHFDYESATGVALASGENLTSYAWKGFNKDSNDIIVSADSDWQTTDITTSWLQYKLNEKRVLKSWRMRECVLQARTPKLFTIEGSNDGLNWTAIDSTYTASNYVGNGIHLWGDLQTIGGNTTAYLYHRINTTLNNGDAGFTQISELELNTILPSDYYLVEEGVMYEYYGPELVTNGGFATDTDWTKGTGWTISGGVASCDGTQIANTYLSQSPATTADVYEITFTISNYVAGSIRGYVGSNADEFISANGTYTQRIVSPGSGVVGIKANLTFVGDVDNISVKKINGNPIERTYLAELMTDSDGDVSWFKNLPVAKQRFSDVEVHNDLTVHGGISNPSVATAWVNFDGTQNPPLIRDSYNVKDVVDLGTGDYKVLFEAESSGADVVVASTQGASTQMICHVNANSKSDVIIKIRNVGTLTDSGNVNVVRFGAKV